MLITSTPTFVMFARAVSFFNAALKTQEKFGFQSRSVPVYKKQGQTSLFSIRQLTEKTAGFDVQQRAEA